MKPFTNPLHDSAAPAAKAPAPPPARTAQDAKPSKDVNHGASPGIIGDRQVIARPPLHRIAATAPVRPSSPQVSGMERAMAELADKTHAPKRR